MAGLAAGLATWLAYRITDHTAHHAAKTFRIGQRLSASMVSLAHGTSDGQKTMGLITLVLVAGGYQQSGTRPYEWVIVAAGLAIALGTYSGGWRIMRTMGKGLVEVEPPQGFAAETAATAAILASSHLGFALSTTHVCSGAILGSGVGRRTKVNWRIAGRMGSAWLLTLPAAAVVGALSALVVNQGLWGFFVMLIVLLAAALVIVRMSMHHKVDHNNVTDSADVNVLPGKRVRGTKTRIRFVTIDETSEASLDDADVAVSATDAGPAVTTVTTGSPMSTGAPSVTINQTPTNTPVAAEPIAATRPAVITAPRPRRRRRVSKLGPATKAVKA
ncbi:MAG: inorganic phosphate transporter [Micrococcales bacterium]|nr:inorganic phosphate transporter [Micrococcales bacterium]